MTDMNHAKAQSTLPGLENAEDKNEKQKCRLKDKKRITNIEQGITNDY